MLGHGDFLHRVYQTEPQPSQHRSFHRLLPQPTRRRHHSLAQELSAGIRLEPGRIRPHHPLDARTCALSRSNRYVIAKGDSRRVVLYWYWAHDRGVASEYWAKYYLVADSIKMNRSDGSLVRITTPLLPGESADSAQERLLPFVRCRSRAANLHSPLKSLLRSVPRTYDSSNCFRGLRVQYHDWCGGSAHLVRSLHPKLENPYMSRSISVRLLLTCSFSPRPSGCSRDPNVRKQKYFDSGEKYFAEGKYREAVIQYRNAIQIDPRFAQAHYQLSQTYLKLGDKNHAFQELNRTLTSRRDNYRAHTDLANLLVTSAKPGRQSGPGHVSSKPRPISIYCARNSPTILKHTRPGPITMPRKTICPTPSKRCSRPLHSTRTVLSPIFCWRYSTAIQPARPSRSQFQESHSRSIPNP